MKVTISLGVVVKTPDAGDSIEILISCADDALYKSKAAGRNQVTFYQATCAWMDSGAPSRTLKKTGTFIFVRELQFSMLIGLLFNMLSPLTRFLNWVYLQNRVKFPMMEIQAS